MTNTDEVALSELGLQVAVSLILRLRFCGKYICVFVAVFCAFIAWSVKQIAGDRGITAENMEKSQHTDINEDTTNKSASVACSSVRL